MSGLQIIPRMSYATVAWKNGGGITHEALRVPMGGARFEWRLSLAQIDKSGPFSDFSGYRRTMVLLQGGGVVLRFADGAVHALTQLGDLIEFDGASAAQCDLLAGPCLDLNLMAANSLSVSAAVRRLERPWEVTASPSETCVIMSLQGSLQVSPAGAALDCLGPLDLAVFEGAGSLVLAPFEPHSHQPPPIFFATISHGRQS